MERIYEIQWDTGSGVQGYYSGSKIIVAGNESSAVQECQKQVQGETNLLCAINITSIRMLKTSSLAAQRN